MGAPENQELPTIVGVAAEHWAAMATDGLSLLYGVRDGDNTLNDVIEHLEARLVRCRERSTGIPYLEGR